MRRRPECLHNGPVPEQYPMLVSNRDHFVNDRTVEYLGNDARANSLNSMRSTALSFGSTATIRKDFFLGLKTRPTPASSRRA